MVKILSPRAFSYFLGRLVYAIFRLFSGEASNLAPNQVTGNRNNLQETYPGELTDDEV
jgi:hypothetical protein